MWWSTVTCWGLTDTALHTASKNEVRTSWRGSQLTKQLLQHTLARAASGCALPKVWQAVLVEFEVGGELLNDFLRRVSTCLRHIDSSVLLSTSC